MLFTLNAFMERQKGDGYIAWIESPKNFKMLVQAATPEATAKELVISLKVSLSYQLGIDIRDISEKQASSDEQLYRELSNELKENGKKELKFQFA
jgi:Holliday junction resolvase